MALIEDGHLVFDVEMEKLRNFTRFSSISDPSFISEVFGLFGRTPEAVDIFAVADEADDIASLGLAGTAESVSADRCNLAASWVTREFQDDTRRCFALVWEGQTFPRLFVMDAGSGEGKEVATLFRLPGHAYAAAAQVWGPFGASRKGSGPDLSVAGKLMAYVALGSVNREAIACFRHGLVDGGAPAEGFTSVGEMQLWLEGFFQRCRAALPITLSDEDALASFHAFLEQCLLKGLRRALVSEENLIGSGNLVISGGCALNIKWNSAIRASGLFSEVWVPPFPNDSGAALGAAAAAMLRHDRPRKLIWSAYSGPALVPLDQDLAGWKRQACDFERLAGIIADGHPVVLLSGRAEIGPRALGNRSIIADARNPEMKARLNRIKRRESYRPVAPVCLEDRATEIFDPGLRDPYMLFDHHLRGNWAEKIPAVVHLDGTARLQTVARDSGTAISDLLQAYEALTGIPVLCNTSANYPGRGFFPDALSAAEWGEVDFIWCDGDLLSRN